MLIPRRALFAEEVAGGVDGPWFMDWQAEGLMDAPDWVPSGGHAVMSFAPYYLKAQATIFRDGVLW